MLKIKHIFNLYVCVCVCDISDDDKCYFKKAGEIDEIFSLIKDI